MFTKRIWYELRVAFGLTSLLPLPALAVFGLLEWLLWRSDSTHSLQMFVTRDFTLLLPLIAGCSVAHLMSVEKEEGFDELRRSYAEPLVLQSLWRTLIAFVFTGLAFGMGWIVYSLASGSPVSLQAILPALPPTLYLMGLSLLVNHLSGSYWAAVGIILGYWFLEVQAQTRGKLTGNLALFHSVWPQGADPTLNPLLLCLMGCLFLAANLLIDQRPRLGSPARS